MIWVRRLFGILVLAVAIILVASIAVTGSRFLTSSAALFRCITDGCSTVSFKNDLIWIVTYLFMAAMVFYLGRKGILMLLSLKQEEPEPTKILDGDDFSHTPESIHYFKTRYGYCHVLPDRIIFANTKTVQDVSVYKEGNKVIATHIVQLIVICAMLYYIFNDLKNADFWKLLTPVLLVLFSSISIITSLRNSTTPLILREKIININFIKGFPYLVTPHFAIWFMDNKNRKRKRVILLADPSEKNISEVLQVFRNASLIIDPI